MNPYVAITLGSLPLVAFVAWAFGLYQREMRRAAQVRTEAVKWRARP